MGDDELFEDEEPLVKVTFSISRSLEPTEEPSEFVFDIHGALTFDDEPPSKAIGWIHARVVEAGRVFNCGESLFDVCDSVDQSLHEYASIAYDFEEESFRDSIAEGTTGLNLLIVESISVAPEHRGRGLGLLAMLRTIDTFEHGCGAAVIKPFPMQFGADRKKVWPDALQLDLFTASKQDAFRSLRRYWKRVGFKPVGKTDFFVLDLAFRRPSTKDVMKRARSKTAGDTTH